MPRLRFPRHDQQFDSQEQDSEPSRLALYVVWVLCLVWSALWLGILWMSAARTSPDKIPVLLGTVAVHLLFGYIFARAFDAIVRR